MTVNRSKRSKRNRGVLTDAIMKNFKIYGAMIFAICAGTIGTIQLMDSRADDGKDKPPEIQIREVVKHENGGFTVHVDASDDNHLEKVEFYLNDKLSYVADSSPYNWTYSEDFNYQGTEVYAKATDNKGNTTKSETHQLNW